MFGYENMYQCNQNLLIQNQQLQQENTFYKTCINNQMQQLSNLKTEVKEARKAAKTTNNKERTALGEINENAQQPSRRSLKRYFDLGHTERAFRNREMENKFTNVASSLSDDIVSVHVEIEFDNGKKKGFFPKSPDVEKYNQQLRYQDKLDNRSLVQKVLVVKDRYRISDDALHELHMIGSTIPSKHHIVDERKRLNSVIPIYLYPGVRYLYNDLFRTENNIK